MNKMIIGAMIVSNKKEPFLAACLESLNEAVDLLVLNDNSSDKNNSNLEIIKKSKLFNQNKVKMLFNPFNGFADARNKCLEYIHSLDRLENSWILKIDADEVHAPALKIIAREILPNLPETVGVVDSYFFHFMQSFDYLYSIDRRHDLLVKYTPNLCWEGKVHEKLLGQQGKRIALPYAFYHYGYVNSKDDILEKWKLYSSCGDNSFPDINKFDKKTFLHWEGRHCVPFNGGHPAYAMNLINKMKLERSAEFDNYRAIINKHCKENKWLKAQNFFRHLNYKFRLYSRMVETSIKFPRLIPNIWSLLKQD